MRFFVKYVCNASEWSAQVGKWLILVVVLIMIYNIILRYIFNAYAGWAYDLSWMLYSANFVVGGAYVLLRKRHIRVDLILNALPSRLRTALEIFFLVVIYLPLVGLLTYSWTQASAESWAINEGSEFTTFHTPIYPLKIIIAIGFFIFALQILVEIINSLQYLFLSMRREK